MSTAISTRRLTTVSFVIACLAMLTAFVPQTLAADHAEKHAPIIDTVAGDGRKDNVGQPFGVELGPDGALYVCDVQNHRIHRHDLKTGKTTVVVGNGKRGFAGDGGPADKATLNEPYEVRFDKQGNMIFVEMMNHLIRRVDAKTGVISTIAGAGKIGFKDGPGKQAMFHRPHSIAIDDKTDTLYVADIGNHRIRAIDLADPKHPVRTVAGNGQRKQPVDGGVAKGKPMIGPRALFITGRTLWIALREGHSVWTMNLDDGKLKHIAGSGKKGYRDGEAAQATFNGPKGIALDKAGDIFVVDTENQVIRRVDGKTYKVTTVAGAGPKARGFGGDGGPATKAKMDRPHGIGIGPDGTLYIGDTNTHRVRRVRFRSK